MAILLSFELKMVSHASSPAADPKQALSCENFDTASAHSVVVFRRAATDRADRTIKQRNLLKAIFLASCSELNDAVTHCT